MRRRGLKSAITKLEARKKPRQFCWPIIIAQYPEEGAGDIIGLKAGDETFERRDGENDLGALALRVQNDAGGPLLFNAPRIMVALYGTAPQPVNFP